MGTPARGVSALIFFVSFVSVLDGFGSLSFSLQCFFFLSLAPGTGAAGAAGVGGTVASFEAGPSHAFPRFAGGHLEYPKLRGRDDADADDDVNHFLSSVNPANPANPAPASPAPVSQPSLPRDFFPPARSPRSPVPPLSWENKIRRDVQTDLQKAVNQVSEPRFAGRLVWKSKWRLVALGSDKIMLHPVKITYDNLCESARGYI